MTIAETKEKCKAIFDRIPRDVVVVLVLVLASLASFGLGYIAGEDAGAVGEGAAGAVVVSSTTGRFVASQHGTKYYPIDCRAATRISDANKIWFVSKTAAIDAGYSLASGCGAQ